MRLLIKKKIKRKNLKSKTIWKKKRAKKTYMFRYAKSDQPTYEILSFANH